jgi:hypothetical protein
MALPLMCVIVSSQKKRSSLEKCRPAPCCGICHCTSRVIFSSLHRKLRAASGICARYGTTFLEGSPIACLHDKWSLLDFFAKLPAHMWRQMPKNRPAVLVRLTLHCAPSCSRTCMSGHADLRTVRCFKCSVRKPRCTAATYHSFTRPQHTCCTLTAREIRHLSSVITQCLYRKLLETETGNVNLEVCTNIMCFVSYPQVCSLQRYVF